MGKHESQHPTLKAAQQSSCVPSWMMSEVPLNALVLASLLALATDFCQAVGSQRRKAPSDQKTKRHTLAEILVLVKTPSESPRQASYLGFDDVG